MDYGTSRLVGFINSVNLYLVLFKDEDLVKISCRITVFIYYIAMSFAKSYLTGGTFVG